MKLDILLQILFVNDMKEVIYTAIRIESGIALPYKVGDSIPTQVNKHDLPENKKLNNGETWGYVALPILAINDYSIKEPYLVQLPNGRAKWISGDPGKTTTNEIVDKDEAAIARQ